MYYRHSYYSNTTMYTTHAYMQLCLYACFARARAHTTTRYEYNIYIIHIRYAIYMIHYNYMSPHTHNQYTYALHTMHIHTNLHVS